MERDDREGDLVQAGVARLSQHLEEGLRTLLLEVIDRERTERHAAVLSARESALADAQAAYDAAEKAHEEAFEAARRQTAADRAGYEEALDAARRQSEADRAAHEQALEAARHETETERAAYREALAAVRREVEALQGTHEEALAAVLRDADARVEERDRLADAALAEARAQAERDLEDLRAQADADLAEARDAHAAELVQLRTETEAALARLREQVEHLVASAAAEEATQLEAQAAPLTAVPAGDGEAASGGATISAPDALVASEADQRVLAAQLEERTAQLGGTERLLDDIRLLDEQRSLTDVLEALTTAVGRQASRAVLLLPQGDRLRGWAQFGFTADGGVPPVDLPLHESGILGEVLQHASTRVVQPRPGEAADVLPGFASLPEGRVGLAMPLIVGGKVVGVLYADDAAHASATVPAAWPEIVEIVTRHGSRCLEALTALRASQAATVGSGRAAAGV